MGSNRDKFGIHPYCGRKTTEIGKKLQFCRNKFFQATLSTGGTSGIMRACGR